jgi:hypothetical protein
MFSIQALSLNLGHLHTRLDRKRIDRRQDQSSSVGQRRTASTENLDVSSATRRAFARAASFLSQLGQHLNQPIQAFRLGVL